MRRKSSLRDRILIWVGILCSLALAAFGGYRLVSDYDFSGCHNIPYGHHIKNGTMFHDIINFKDADFFKAHREFTICTAERVLHLRTIAAVRVSGTDDARRRTSFTGTAQLRIYLEKMTQGCAFRDIPKGEISTVYSLVTCSYEAQNNRTILYAAETSAWESTAGQGASSAAK